MKDHAVYFIFYIFGVTAKTSWEPAYKSLEFERSVMKTLS